MMSLSSTRLRPLKARMKQARSLPLFFSIAVATLAIQPARAHCWRRLRRWATLPFTTRWFFPTDMILRRLIQRFWLSAEDPRI